MALDIIGAGLGRTGTMSLKVALERLGFGPCYHMIEVMADPRRPAQWIDAARGAADWDSIFDGFRSTVDYPGCMYWRELTEKYPNAKVLLTVRDPDDWFESTQATIFSPHMRVRIEGSPVEPFLDATVWGHYGDRINDREFMTDVFRSHVAAVEQGVPAPRLLTYRVGDGWEPLCEFLGVAVPEGPFPRVNSREELGAMIDEQADAVAAAGAPPGLEEMSAHAKARLAELGTAARPDPTPDSSADS